MSDERSDVVKKARLDMGHSDAGPSRIQQSTDFLELNDDCLMELFEYLSLADLRALRQTCKRLNQVVDGFVTKNFPAVKFGFRRIIMSDWDFTIMGLDPAEAKWIKKANINESDMDDEKIDDLQIILPHLECLRFYETNVQANFYESILKWCSNLQSLYIIDTTFNMENPNDADHWLNRELPTIQKLHITYDSVELGDEMERLVTFVEMNPNIQTLSIDSTVLQSERVEFLGTNIKIDQLNVYIYSGDELIFVMLNGLYEQGFYKRLHVHAASVEDQTFVEQIASLRGLEKLCFDEFEFETPTPITLPAMPDLLELCFTELNEPQHCDMDSAAKDLVNLQRVWFETGKIDDIIPFIRYARKVEKIKIDSFENIKNDGLEVIDPSTNKFFKDGIIDLQALNKEREGLDGASNVTIYVEEHIFLSTKFATKEMYKFELVTLKRAQAVKWICDEFRDY